VNRSQPARLFLLVVLALPLAACSLAPVSEREGLREHWRPPDWTAWRLTGRISVHYGEEGWHAGLVWRQSPETFDLRLQGPLGQGALLLQGDGDRVALQDARGQRDTAGDAETLMRQHLGWELPVSGLRYWVRGEAQPGPTAQWQRDVEGRPEQLIQSGWRIDYSRYQPAPGGGTLPGRIDFERPDLQARLIIDRWEAIDGGGSGR
jgi:outer membrane lipoprotein LolB